MTFTVSGRLASLPFHSYDAPSVAAQEPAKAPESAPSREPERARAVAATTRGVIAAGLTGVGVSAFGMCMLSAIGAAMHGQQSASVAAVAGIVSAFATLKAATVIDASNAVVRAAGDAAVKAVRFAEGYAAATGVAFMLLIGAPLAMSASTSGLDWQTGGIAALAAAFFAMINGDPTAGARRAVSEGLA